MQPTNLIAAPVSRITRAQRAQVNGHPAFVIWITGLSGAGKSTLANALEETLFTSQYKTMLLDGDNLRHGLCQDLHFSLADRTENLRRAAEVSKLMLDAGLIVIAAFISPMEKDRELVKHIVGNNYYVEVYCECSLNTCEARDPKGLYKSARAGKLANFTGIDSPYEIPVNPDVVIDSETTPVHENVAHVMAFLTQRQLLSC